MARLASLLRSHYPRRGPRLWVRPPLARSVFTDPVPVDDRISGLNESQQQVRVYLYV